MHITINRTELNTALSHAARAVSARAANEILSGVLLDARDDTLTVTGNDLEMGIIATVSADITEPGAVVLDAKVFAGIVAKLPGDDVEISVGAHIAVIKSGRAKYELCALSADNYPAPPDVSSMQTIEIPQETLKRQLNQVIFAASGDQTKHIHTGVLFDIEPNKLTLVALDGHRMALRHEEIKAEQAARVVIPATSLNELVKMLDDGVAELHIGKRHVLFDLGGITLTTRILDGEFFNYKKGIPQSFSFSMSTKIRPMAAALERVSLLINDKLKTPVRLIFSENRVDVTCKTPLGQAQDILPCECFDEMEIGFNHRYLLDALKHMDGERFTFETNGSISPCVLKSDGNAVFMVLPVRLEV